MKKTSTNKEKMKLSRGKEVKRMKKTTNKEK